MILDGDNAVLTYHKAMVAPPEGIDPVYTRSGFIHPVKTPKGQVVTGIHPADHYHHLGLWHAWVKCKYGGEEVDFWNLKKKQGAVRYSSTLRLMAERHGAGFEVAQEHVLYPGEKDREIVVLKERFHIMARRVGGVYEIDYQTSQRNVTDLPLDLPAYRYGGPLAYRAPGHWVNGNSNYLSSEGRTRKDGHQTRSRWCAMYGPGTEKEGAEMATIGILCHRDNHDFPQRMRVWPPTSNDGRIFFNYVPIQQTGWSIRPGQTSLMRYRLIVADGPPDTDQLNGRWEAFVE